MLRTAVRETYTALVPILTIVLLQADPSFGQSAQPSAQRGSKEINVTADSLSVGDGGSQIEAKGNVEVRRDETILKADEVRMNRTTQDVEAKGKVSVDDPEWKLKESEALRLNMEKETGTIEKGDIFLERGHLSASGRRFQKLPGQAYHIDEGFFTTCLCESGPPTWRIAADEIDLSKEGEGTVRRGTFYIMDVPILYIPYGYFPVRTERQTGFLFPTVGSSSKSGFRFEQPFFWAISKSSDATFGVDIESRARIGLLGEYRTVFSRDAQFQINLSYFNEGLRKNENSFIGDRTIADPEIPQNRWNVLATHRATISSGWITYSDIAAFSDDLFARELVGRLHQNLETAQERTLRAGRYSPSRFGLFRSWGDMSLVGEWAFYQDFIQEDARTFQKSPQILFKGRQFLEALPLEFRWRAEGIQYVRKEGADGLRLDLRPQLVLPFGVAPYLSGSFDLAPRETLYHLYRSEGDFDRNKSRELIELRGKVGTSFGRIFDLDGDLLKKVKHVIEPELSYLFIPRSDERDIPIMDGTDRINRRNLLTFSLTNRFWGKFAQEPIGLPSDRDVELVTSPTVGDIRELGRLKLALSYDIDKERKGGDSLSDLDMSMRITPQDYFAMGLDLGLKPGSWQITQAAAILSLSDPRPITRRVLDRDFMQPNSLDLSFRFIRRGINSPFGDNANLTTADLTLPPLCPAPAGLFDPRCERLVHRNVVGQLGVRALVHLTDRVLFLYDANFNARDGRFTTNRGGIKLLSQCECWTVTFTLNRETNPSETSFRFSFNLLGLGSQVKELFR